MSTNNQKLITNNFKNYSVNQFIEAITEPANNVFYVFAGKHTGFAGGDSTVPVPNNSVQTLYVDTYNQMVFGKQILASDVKPMVQRYDWQSGTVYTQYDHTDGDLYKKNFFTVTRVGSNYYVFKCLYNNNGSASIIRPDFNETSADDILYETSDGYQWKYLYTITKDIYDKFVTNDYIPIVEDANTSANAMLGAIDVILVTSNGSGYNNYYSGQFNSDDISVGGNTIVYNLGTSASSSNNYYANSVLSIVEGAGKGQYRLIEQYRVLRNSKQIVVNGAFTTTLDSTSRYEITPYVSITGDGRQTACCEARAIVNAAASNSIYKIEILNRGAGYTYANAFITVPSALSISNVAVLKVISPPSGGHGSNAQSELNATKIGISVNLSNSESNTISTENDYRTIGILKDPRFANVGLTVSNVSGTFVSNERLYQMRPIKIDGLVSINTTSNTITSNTVNFLDTFKPDDYVYIQDDKGNEITSVLVTSGGVNYETGESLIFTGGGGKNAVGYTVCVNGAIYGVKLKSITAVTMVTPGTGFGTTPQTVTLTGVTSGASSAIGTATISTGGVTAVAITDGGNGYTSGETVNIKGTTYSTAATGTVTITATGSGFVTGQTVNIKGSNSVVNTATGLATATSGALTAVSIVDAAYSYVENEILQISSSTSTVNATATSDIVNGFIKSILLTSRGTSYSSAPAVTISTLAGSGASLTAVANASPVTTRRILAQVGSVVNSSTMSLKSNGTYIDSTSSIYLANVQSYGTIDTFDGSLIQTQNTVGFFTANSLVIGNTSLATANIDFIQISSTTKPYTTFTQTTRYTGPTTGAFIEDEKVYISGSFPSNGYVQSYDGVSSSIYVTEQQGQFYLGNVVIGATSTASMTINNIYSGDLVPWSGDVMYIQQFEPISRSAEQTETIKIILEL